MTLLDGIWYVRVGCKTWSKAQISKGRYRSIRRFPRGAAVGGTSSELAGTVDGRYPSHRRAGESSRQPYGHGSKFGRQGRRRRCRRPTPGSLRPFLERHARHPIVHVLGPPAQLVEDDVEESTVQPFRRLLNEVVMALDVHGEGPAALVSVSAALVGKGGGVQAGVSTTAAAVAAASGPAAVAIRTEGAAAPARRRKGAIGTKSARARHGDRGGGRRLGRRRSLAPTAAVVPSEEGLDGLEHGCGSQYDKGGCYC